MTYPNGKLAPNAQYWIGMAYAAQRDYKNSIGAQQKLLASWPEDAKAPDAMLNIATSQEAMGDRRGAQKTLEALLVKYPASQAAVSAKQRPNEPVPPVTRMVRSARKSGDAWAIRPLLQPRSLTPSPNAGGAGVRFRAETTHEARAFRRRQHARSLA